MPHAVSGVVMEIVWAINKEIGIVANVIFSTFG